MLAASDKNWVVSIFVSKAVSKFLNLLILVIVKGEEILSVVDTESNFSDY